MYLWYDRAAGIARCSWDRPGQHYDLVGEYPSEAEAATALEDLAGDPPVWAVFVRPGYNDGYVSRETAISGNWRGSGHYPYDLVGEYQSEGEAEKALRQILFG